MADPERAKSREHAGKRGKRSIELPDAIAAEVTLLPTPVGSDGQGLTDGDNREGGASLREIPRLLPTPTAGDAAASGSRNLEGSKAHAGVSLTDAIQSGGSTTPRLLPTPTAADDNRLLDHKHAGGNHTLQSAVYEETASPRLLPTPQAADGDGGRQEKGAMGNAGVRPSGQKATLPLPTAVAMRGELTETPFARPDEDDQLVLLPTPVANDANPGAGGELRAAIVHGEGRRNETGIDTLGRPNDGRPSGLLPTPQAHDSHRGKTLEQRARHREATGGGAFNLNEVIEAELAEPRLLPTPTTQDAANTAGDSQRDRNSDPLNVVAADLGEPQLLPTPRVTSERNSRKAMVENQQWSSVSLAQAAEIAEGRLPREFDSWDEVPGELGRDARERLLPTPQAADGDRSSEQGPRHYIEGGDNPTLLGAARRAEVQWGVYEAAVRRWEYVLDRPAPAPTDEKGRLDPPFVEWMLGYPEGWFDVDGVSRTRKLKALGNSVQVQCGEAVGGWLAFLIESGLLV